MKPLQLLAAGFLVWLAWKGYQTIAAIQTAPGPLNRNIDPSTGRPLF